MPLFVGGSHDGERIEVTEKVVRLPVFALCDLVPHPANVKPMEYEEYESLWIRGRDKEFTIYVLVGMSPDQAISQLISRYRA